MLPVALLAPVADDDGGNPVARPSADAIGAGAVQAIPSQPAVFPPRTLSPRLRRPEDSGGVSGGGDV
ncbi:hypothetical protein QCD71_15010 [Sphingomonas sp. PsM26]|nr:hypothetical protein [Sphingomonas sp. PsM26]